MIIMTMIVIAILLLPLIVNHNDKDNGDINNEYNNPNIWNLKFSDDDNDADVNDDVDGNGDDDNGEEEEGGKRRTIVTMMIIMVMITFKIVIITMKVIKFTMRIMITTIPMKIMIQQKFYLNNNIDYDGGVIIFYVIIILTPSLPSSL